MRTRLLGVLVTTVALVVGLSWPAAAVWTSVNGEVYQVQRLCRDGMIIDLAAQGEGPWPVYIDVADSTGRLFYAGVVRIPSIATRSVPQMWDPLGFAIHSFQHYNRIYWDPRPVGSVVLLKVGFTDTFRAMTISDCKIGYPSDPFDVGYVWADQPTTSTYKPGQYWSYNSRLLDNTVTRTGVGAYTVDFPGLAGSRGNAQVTAFGATPAICTIGGARWYPVGTAMRLSVRCFAPNGAPADTRFTAAYTAGAGKTDTPTHAYAFALADQPTVTAAYPAKIYYNNSGGAVTAAKVGPGTYVVTVPHLYGPRAAGSVKVTAIGDTAGYCKVMNWGPAATAQTIAVRCSTHTGVATDRQFSIVYQDGTNHVDSNRMSSAYVWANEPLRDSYTPWPTYQRSTAMNQSGSVTINRDYAGAYDVHLPYQRGGFDSARGPAWDGGNVQVTAYGSDATRCQVAYWQDGPFEQRSRVVRVRCFTATGAEADNLFTLQYTAQLQ